MALNKQDREQIVKIAAEVNRQNEIKFSQSGGSVYIGYDKYTDAHYAKKNLFGK
jgi:hypothetical protein